MTVIFASGKYPRAGTIAPSVHKFLQLYWQFPLMAVGGRPNLSSTADNLLDNNVVII